MYCMFSVFVIAYWWNRTFTTFRCYGQYSTWTLKGQDCLLISLTIKTGLWQWSGAINSVIKQWYKLGFGFSASLHGIVQMRTLELSCYEMKTKILPYAYPWILMIRLPRILWICLLVCIHRPPLSVMWKLIGWLILWDHLNIKWTAHQCYKINL